MPKDVRVKPKNVTLYPDHWDVIDEHAENKSYSSRSASLRRIIDEWVAFKSADSSIRPTASDARELV